MQLIHKALDFQVRQVGNPEYRILEFIGSTAAVDRYGDIIEPAGWDLKNYKKNPVFLWGHNYSMPPIGKAVSVKVTDDALVFQIQFATAEEYAFADTIYRLYLGGFLKATSVGFQDLEREPIIDQKNEGRQTGGATAYWVSENKEITESALKVGELKMIPKKVAALTKLSNELVRMSKVIKRRIDPKVDLAQWAKPILTEEIKKAGLLKAG